MTQEKKAKLYDELKVKAQELAEDGYIDKLALVDMFPELKESRDEMIRQLLISFVKYDMPDNYSDDFSKEDCLAWLEKRGEQKPADKVEPKFKVGDFLVSDYCMGKVVELTNDAYLLDTGQGIPFSCEHNAHLWTIQDAKDGDVLADNVGVILFRKIGNEEFADVVDYHCVVNIWGEFKIQKGVGYYGYTKDEQLRPATKEQRERFFATMRVAGYEWDADKKELKKIEQKPVDKKGMNLVEEETTPFQKEVFCIIDTAIEEEQGLKQVCDKLFALASNEIKQKFSWSEEDEKHIMAIDLAVNRCDGKWNCCGEKCPISEHSPWLKSLKGRYTWLPSDEQMHYLSWVANIKLGDSVVEQEVSKHLNELLEDLKKLKGE